MSEEIDELEQQVRSLEATVDALLNELADSKAQLRELEQRVEDIEEQSDVTNDEDDSNTDILIS